uniref:Acid sphingomyelinase-like phosphodiesterase 3a n=1 Tax=Lygus hesperus TaxID=30085 RepID=A0A0A9WM34_LYGHE
MLADSMVQLKTVLTAHADIISVALFGHRNLNSIKNIKSVEGIPIIPSITVAGVSPRHLNNPSFDYMYLDPKTYRVLDFFPAYLDMVEQNHISRAFALETAAQDAGDEVDVYIGNWRYHDGVARSWRSLTGYGSLNTQTVDSLVRTLAFDPVVAKSLQLWKTGGLTLSETPEDLVCKALYEDEDAVQMCIYPFYDPAAKSSKDSKVK